MTIVRIVVQDAIALARQRRRERITKWIMFTLLFGLCSLLATAIIERKSLTITNLVGQAELYVFATVLLGDALARIFNKSATKQVEGIVCFGVLDLALRMRIP